MFIDALRINPKPRYPGTQNPNAPNPCPKQETETALAEAGVWHKARVAGRATTRLLITMPPETQELFLMEHNFQVRLQTYSKVKC